MKITEDHMQRLTRLVDRALGTEEGRLMQAKRHDFSPERYRWEVLQLAVDSSFLIELYGYLNDRHIDTAMCSIIDRTSPM